MFCLDMVFKLAWDSGTVEEIFLPTTPTWQSWCNWIASESASIWKISFAVVPHAHLFLFLLITTHRLFWIWILSSAYFRVCIFFFSNIACGCGPTSRLNGHRKTEDCHEQAKVERRVDAQGCQEFESNCWGADDRLDFIGSNKVGSELAWKGLQSNL